MRITRDQFLLDIDEILGLRPGTLQGHEKLEDLENWDSTSMISLVVLADSYSQVQISPEQIVTCTTVADFLRLAQVEGGS